MEKSMTTEKVGLKKLISYSLGEVGCQMSWYMINTYLTVFYTDIVGLTSTAISFIMLVARIWDAINDPMMGNICDRTHSRWGKFRPYLMFAPPFLAVFNILTFTVFPVTGINKVILCLVTYVLTGMAYTACSISYQALQNVSAIETKARMNLATARGIGGSVIGIVLSAVAAPALLFFSNRQADGSMAAVADAKGYFIFTVILSAVMLPVFWLCAAGCKETHTERLHGDRNAQQEKMGLVKSITEVCKNDQLLRVVLATVLGTICVSGRMGLLTYYVIYVVGDFKHIATVFTVMTFAQLVGTMTLPLGTKALTKRGYLIALQTLMNIGFLCMFLFAKGGIVPVLVFSAICGLCNASSSICPGLVGDSLEYGAWKLGKRQEGVAASLLSFGVKLSTAISGAAGVLLLGAVGYVANAEQTAATKQGINIIVNLVPFIIGVLSILPMIGYKLNPEKIAAIREDLDNGKTKENSNLTI